MTEVVHRARLAADDPDCVGCPHGRGDSREPFEFDRGNIRGSYLNSVDRAVVRKWFRSLARHLSQSDSGGVRPKVVCGHDERSSSPDLVVNAREITLAGCDVLDVGRTTGPLVDFAVRRAGADAGVLITGGNRPAGWTGVDLVGRGARPWSWPGQAEEACTGHEERLSRRAGQSQTGSIDARYLEDLQLAAHGLRPLTAIVLCQTAKSALLCTELAAHWPGQTLVDRVSRHEARDVVGTVQSMRYRGFPSFDMAALISLDCRELTIVDEAGQIIAPRDLVFGLAELGGSTGCKYDEREWTQAITEEEIDAVDCAAWRLDRGVVTGVDSHGFRRRDAFWLLSQVMQRLSVSDQIASHVFRNRS